MLIITAALTAGSCETGYFEGSNLSEKLLVFDRSWYGSRVARDVADNMLLYQRSSGGWPKNIDYFIQVDKKTLTRLKTKKNSPRATLDNGATHVQLQFLGRVIKFHPEAKYIQSFINGIEYILEAQYDNGGWPQYYPLRNGYYTHITYNDDAMIGALRILYSVSKDWYGFVPSELQERARKAVNQGIECILKTQVVVDGELTAWCAQHDEKTLKPVGARAYELPSLSGKESAGIIQFLMEIENPSADIYKSVSSAIAWFEKVQIHGIRIERVKDKSSPTGSNKIVVKDRNVPPIWARFYQIGSNKPIYSDRDGKIYGSMAEISSERRNEYAWLGYWPEKIMECYHNSWKYQFESEKEKP